MNHLKILKNHLLEEIEKINKSLSSARIERDNAPTAMESKSDTSRSRLESEVTMYEHKLIDLKETIGLIPNEKSSNNIIELWSFVCVKFPSGKLQLIVVTEGLGGSKIGEIQCISDRTPMCSALIGKKRGEKFTFKGISGKVLSVK